MKNLTWDSWIYWITATAAACVCLSAFIFQTFQTKAEAKGYQDNAERMLQRIEIKIDKLEEKIDQIRNKT